MSEPFPFTTVALPDGIVVGGPWPHTTVAWPGGKGRGATKPEYDLFQALEKEHARAESLRTIADKLLTDLENVVEGLDAEEAAQVAEMRRIITEAKS